MGTLKSDSLVFFRHTDITDKDLSNIERRFPQKNISCVKTLNNSNKNKLGESNKNLVVSCF